jgi:hypothetical protein
VWFKGQQDGGSAFGMRPAGQPANDLAVPAMDTVEDADSQPGILHGVKRGAMRGYFFEGVIMSHEMKKPP